MSARLKNAPPISPLSERLSGSALSSARPSAAGSETTGCACPSSLRASCHGSTGFTDISFCPNLSSPKIGAPFSLLRSNPINALLELRKHRLVLGLSTCSFISGIAHQVYPGIRVLYTGYRYGWGTNQTGLSLALVGLMAAIVQGGLTRKIIPKIGERRSAFAGLLSMSAALTGYGIAPAGWMVYGIIIFGSLSGIAVPAIQGMISRTVGDNEQGGIEGSLTSLQSVPSAIRPPLATGVFGFFIGSKAPAIVPGAPFFLSSGLAVKQRCRPRGVFGEIRRRGDRFSRRLAEKIRRVDG